MEKNCNDCSHDSEQVRTYIDEETGMLCAEICDEYVKLPKDTIVLIPLVCTDCGTLNWKSVNTSEDGQHVNVEKEFEDKNNEDSSKEIYEEDIEEQLSKLDPDEIDQELNDLETDEIENHLDDLETDDSDLMDTDLD